MIDFKPVATGYCFLEAPRADGDVVWFTDLLLGGLRRLRPGGQIDEFLPDRTKIGGAALNEDGCIVCGGTGGIAWLNPVTGKSGMLLEVADGKPIDCVNDMLPDGKGGLYFGTSHTRLHQREETPPPLAIYRLDPDGRVTRLADGLRLCNGIGLSPDGRRLYHNESLVGTFVYDIQPDGSLKDKTLFCPETDCDGLAMDREGGVWIAGFDSGSIRRILPNGKVDRRERLPVKNVMSLCFGGADWRDLYVATAGNQGVDKMMAGVSPPREASLYKARSDIAGLPVPRTGFRITAS